MLLENKIYKKRDILVFVQSRQSDIIKRLKRRINYNQILLERFKSIQYSTNYKKRKSDFIIKNDFTKKSVNDGIKNILKELI